MMMIRLTVLAAFLAASTAFAQTPAQSTAAQAGQKKPPTVVATVPAALKPYQGTWILTSPDGQPLAQGGEMTLTITGDKYAQAVAGAVNERGTIKLDATKKPAWIDLTITEGADAGKQQVGLIEVTGGTMKGVFGQVGATTRPANLAAAPGMISFVGKKKPA
jgi:uncharacterized protein (TIGR03067 family)